VDVNEVLYRGAEAEIVAEEFLGRPVAKTYRHPELDQRIRKERTRLEAQILSEVRAAGVSAPAVIDIDLAQATLRISRVGGQRLRDVLTERPAERAVLCKRFGALVGKLHAAGFVHGDLTTSNVHVDGEAMILLDFGLAERSREVEEQGVDLHLVERTFESSHPSLTGAFADFLTGYKTTYADAHLVERRMLEIKSRARYA
jgi:Kae1-associated kinase Bud32